MAQATQMCQMCLAYNKHFQQYKSTVEMVSCWVVPRGHDAERLEQEFTTFGAHACRAEEVIVTTDADVTARVMEITSGKGAWASINPIGGEASRYLPSCKAQVHCRATCKHHVLVIPVMSASYVATQESPGQLTCGLADRCVKDLPQSWCLLPA